MLIYPYKQFINIDLSTNNKIVVMKYIDSEIFEILYKIIFGLYNKHNLYSSDFKQLIINNKKVEFYISFI